MNHDANQEGVIIVQEAGEPVVLVRKNGSVKYYKLTEMNFADHIEFLNADKAQRANHG